MKPTTTSIHLGHEASAAHIENCLNSMGDAPGCAEAVASEFEEIATEAGSAATLCIHTATALVPVDELNDDDHDYAECLRVAFERINDAITNGEFA